MSSGAPQPGGFLYPRLAEVLLQAAGTQQHPVTLKQEGAQANPLPFGLWGGSQGCPREAEGDEEHFSLCLNVNWH